MNPTDLGLLDVPDDRRLADNVHPSTWTNPTAAGVYDLVAIGGGAAGLVSSIGAAGLGARVALVERHLLGGDCLVTGCVPSKAVLHGARAGLSFDETMERMRQLRADISRHDSARRFTEAGVDVFLGDARFTGPDRLDVAGQTLRFKRAVIATGARPRTLDGIDALTSEAIFNLTERPERLVVIGAGPIGCELAQAFSRLGSQVTVVSLDDEVLPWEDPDARALVQNALVRDGVTLCLGARVLRTEGDILVFDRGQGEERVPSDSRLLAVGRVPNTDLGLEAAGVAFDARGVTVDHRLRTTNRRIYAAGDVIGGGFTHAADAHARIVLRNALFFGRASREDLVVPACTYTFPEVATVGRMDAGTAFRVDLSEVDRSVLDGENEGFAKVWVADNGRILGATVVAKGAGELIAPAVLAMTEGLKLGALGGAIVPYPTRTDVWRRLAGAWNRTRLTERARAWLRRWFRWLR